MKNLWERITWLYYSENQNGPMALDIHTQVPERSFPFLEGKYYKCEHNFVL